MPRPRLPIDDQAVLAAYAEGHSIPTIAVLMSVDRSRITRVVKDAGLFIDQRGAHWAQKRQDGAA